MPFFYFIISFLASIVGAISGIGGGVIIKPVMDSLSPFSVSLISFLSGNTVLAMTLSTLIRNRKSGIKLDKKISSLLAIGGICGGLAGKYIFDIIKSSYDNDGIIGTSQSIILAALTLGVLFFTIFKGRIPSTSIKNPVICLITGIILGGIASFLGIGGGPINLAVLYLFFSMDSKTAALNSIYIIFFSQIANFLFTLFTGRIPDFQPLILILMMGGGIVGGIIGSLFSRRMTNRHVDILFSIVMAIIIGICIFNAINYAELL